MTPDEQEVVRRALAATPPPGPMPPQVASRLEATITELAAVRAAELAAGTGNATGTLADLESRRRRRWPRVLVAAASVAVLAYGVGAVLQDAGPTAETAASDAGADSGAEAEGRSATQGETGAEAAPLEPPAPTVLSRDAAVVELSTATLRGDVRRFLASDRPAALPGELDTRDDAGDGAWRYSREDGSCTVPDLRPGDDLVAALLDGRRASLVLRQAAGGTREAEVYRCGDGRTLLAATEVPARR